MAGHLPASGNEYQDELSHSRSFSTLFSVPVLLRREKRAKGWGSAASQSKNTTQLNLWVCVVTHSLQPQNYAGWKDL